MRNNAGKAVIISLVLLGLTAACTEREGDTQSEATPVATPVAEPAVVTKPLSMKVTDIRLKRGVGQNKSCNVESAGGMEFASVQPRVSRSKAFDIRGWIIDEQTKSVPDNVKLRLQTANGVSAWEQGVTERSERADVAAHYGEEAYLKSGFRVNLDIAELAPGDYVVYMAFDGSDGEAVCGLGRRITLTP